MTIFGVLPLPPFFWVALQMVMPQKGISEELQHLSHVFLSAHAAAVTINAYHKTASLSIRVGKGIPGNYSHSSHWGRYTSTWNGSIQLIPKCYFALPSWHKIEGSKDRIHFLKAFCPSYWLLIKSRVSVTCLPSVLETNSTSQSEDGQNTTENKKLYFQFKGKLMLNIGPTAVFTQHS